MAPSPEIRGGTNAPTSNGLSVGRGSIGVVHPDATVDALDRGQYAFLLGSYPGDGHIVVGRRDVASLSVFCADDYPEIRDEIEGALRAVMPTSSVTHVRRTGCRELKSYAKHWPCLFPQHGAGRKHQRPIVLEPWQLTIVEQHPGPLLRGLIHSDGCRITNWVQRRTPSGVKRYEYPRYIFSNKSGDILRICEAALDRVGVEHRRPRWDMVSVARRAAVARLDEFVGPKSWDASGRRMRPPSRPRGHWGPYSALNRVRPAGRRARAPSATAPARRDDARRRAT